MPVGQTFSSNNEIFQSLQNDSYQFPNGETVKEFKQRVKDELEYIFGNIENGSEAIVVTHGFFIGTAIGLSIGFNNYPFPIGNIENTSISTLIKRDSITQVNKFNDSLHLSELNIDFPRETTKNKITFIRHGQTDSNTSGIWQGHIDNPLNETGKHTAQKLRNTFDEYDVYLSSTYQRALETGVLGSSGDFSIVDLGLAGSAYFYGYALGKFLNGFLADYANIKRFFTFGLITSGAINISMGLNQSLTLWIIFWFLNGWVQGIGAPSCAIALTNWFSPKERGWYYGLWSTAHAIGEGLLLRED